MVKQIYINQNFNYNMSFVILDLNKYIYRYLDLYIYRHHNVLLHKRQDSCHIRYPMGFRSTSLHKWGAECMKNLAMKTIDKSRQIDKYLQFK